MLKETINYTDFNGVERTEDFYFNLTKAELVEMELSTNGGYAEYCQKISQAQDSPELVKLFKEFILKTYGEKSADGKYFNKVDENGRPLANKFAQSGAYPVLFMKLATNAEAAAKFMNGVVPADMSKQ